MILYFSATGNCKYVASRIAKQTNDNIISIADCIKQKSFNFTLNPKESLGIISPTYAWGLPSIVIEFLKKLHISFFKKPYVYFVATYGTTSGQTGRYANQHLQKNGISVDSYFSVKMPDTWTPTFDLSNSEKVKKINKKAEPQIDFVIEKISKFEYGDFMTRKVPYLATQIFYPFEYNRMRQTKHLHVTDTCIGCSLCAKECPVNAIKMKDGKPFWVDDQCVMCLSYLHHCPKFAIQYDNRTKDHGQYKNPNVH